jgi:WXG100 family type VII secretion target
VSQIALSPDELRKAAADFTQARADGQAILLRLEKTTARMEATWAGVSQKVFFRNFLEWKQYMEGMSVLLKKTARELETMAEEYDREDS